MRELTRQQINSLRDFLHDLYKATEHNKRNHFNYKMFDLSNWRDCFSFQYNDWDDQVHVMLKSVYFKKEGIFQCKKETFFDLNLIFKKDLSGSHYVNDVGITVVEWNKDYANFNEFLSKLKVDTCLDIKDSILDTLLHHTQKGKYDNRFY